MDIIQELKLMHGAGIVHCDLRLENLQVREGRLIIGDWGVERDGHDRKPRWPIGTVSTAASDILAACLLANFAQ